MLANTAIPLDYTHDLRIEVIPAHLYYLCAFQAIIDLADFAAGLATLVADGNTLETGAEERANSAAAVHVPRHALAVQTLDWIRANLEDEIIAHVAYHISIRFCSWPYT